MAERGVIETRFAADSSMRAARKPISAGLRRRLAAGAASLFVILAVLVVLSASRGPAAIPYQTAAQVLLHRVGFPTTDFNTAEQRIVEQIRLPRIVVALLVGLTLGVAGAVLQGLFRNPLADPGVIGVSSGGALGAVAAIASGLAAAHRLALPASALAGALLAAFSVYAVAAGRGRSSPLTLVLAGVAVSAFASSITSTIISFTEERERNREILFWLLGGLDNRGWEHAALLVLPALAGTLICTAFSRDLNAMLLGDEGARSLGVSTSTTRVVLLATAAVMTGVAVAVSGIISFVGLMVPHLVRLIVGYDHRLVVPLSGLAGAALVVAADLVARSVIQPAELRVGIVTAALGAPFFLYLIYRSGPTRGSGLEG